MRQTGLGEQLRKVEAELAAGHAEQALALCQEVQTRYPRALSVWRVSGEVYLTLRKPREALGALERALAGDPEDARALCARAIVHQMHGDTTAALAWYRRACDVRPDDQVLRSTYSELAAHMGQPAYQPTRMGLARLYLRGDLLAHALREWEALVAEQPGQLEIQMGLAEAYWRAQQPQAALDSCQRILANAPFYVKAHVLLAALLLDRGEREEARRHAERAAELDPEQRIAQTLFADRLAAGDDALRILLFERASAASRPLASTPRATLPAETQHLLSETEYMLWGPDEETRSRAAARNRAAGAASSSASGSASGVGRPVPVDRGNPNQSTAPRQPNASSPLGQSGSIPAAGAAASNMANNTAGSGQGGLDWVQWLQAQGARALPGTANPTGSDTRGTIDTGDTSSPAAPPAASVPSRNGSVPSQPIPTSGQVSSNTEALRAMFAQLDPGTRSGVIPAASASAQMPAILSGTTAGAPFETPSASPASSASSPAVPNGAFDAFASSSASSSGMARPHQQAWDSSAGTPAGWLAEDSAQPHLLGQRRRESETERLAHAQALREAGPGGSGLLGSGSNADAVTLEALQRDFTASGFLPVEPQPGLLAAMSAGDSSIISPVPSSSSSSITSARIPSLGPKRVELPESIAEDMPGRLRLARTWRQEGRLDDALAEYRALIKQAPDLLPQLLDELHECLKQSPENPEVHRLLGDARIQQGDYLGALEAYNRAVALTHPDEL